VRVGLTPEGRALRESAAHEPARATGLTPEEFPVLQQAVVKLRNNLVKAAPGKG
jgi:hypothetical protein